MNKEIGYAMHLKQKQRVKLISLMRVKYEFENHENKLWITTVMYDLLKQAFLTAGSSIPIPK